MGTVTLTDAELSILVRSRDSLTFGSRDNRDRAAKLAGSGFRKSSIRGQLLDAHYILDAEDRTDYGLGNVKVYWPTLYELDRQRR